MLGKDAHEDVEHRAGHDLGQFVRFEVAGERRHGLLVQPVRR